MKIFSAGAGVKNHENFCVKYGLSKLYSILHEKGYINKFKNRNPNTFLMVDSGAHSWNKTTINKVATHSIKSTLPSIEKHFEFYKDFLLKNKDKKCIFVELDVYGVVNKKIIDDFYYYINSLPNKKFQFIRVYHPIIDNGTLTEFKKWIKEGQKYIGIGNDSTHLLNKIFSLTKDKVKIHGFAMIKNTLLAKYPFYSVDSTQALSTIQFGVRFTKKNLISKSKQARIKHPDMFLSDQSALENAIKYLKSKETYYTHLWEKRGVRWKN